MDQLHDLLTRDVFHGLNLLVVLGFVAMDIGLSQSRQGRSRVPVAFVLMGLGTALVIAGLYVAHAPS